MRTHQIALSGLLLCLPLSGLMLTGTGCAGSRYERSTGTYVDDQALTAKVKTEMFKDSDVSGFDVTVNTYRGEVQLSGFVDTPAQKDRAALIARQVPGVQMVVNNLEVKPSPQTAVGSPGATVQGQSRTVAEPAPGRSANELDRNLTPGRSTGELPIRETDTPSALPRDDGRLSSGTTALQNLAGSRDVEIELSKGKATLRGTVASQAEKQDLHQRISQIPGVEDVDNRLEVRPPAPVRE